MGQRSTTRRPARRFDVVRMEIMNARTGETVAVPQFDYTAANIQAAIDTGATADIRCVACGESVADCPDIRPLLRSVPESWSWRNNA